MKVIIVGAGLGGLACAIACRRENFEVLVLEKVSTIVPIGAGIQIPPNGARVLRRLGVLPEVIEEGTVLQSLDTRRYEDGSILLSKPVGQAFVRVYGEPWIVIHREDYHHVLYEKAKAIGVKVRLGATVEAVDFKDTSVTLRTGEAVHADVVVGADGLWSTLRPFFVGHPCQPLESGELCYRATISRSQLLSLQDPRIDALCTKNTVSGWMGPGRHSVFYPVKHGAQFNLVMTRPDDLPTGARTLSGQLEEMRAMYEGWDEVLSKIISCVSSALKWKICYQSELESWVKNHFVLLGDACHASLPYQAQGASLAIEDGAVLGRLLGLLSSSHPSSASVSKAPAEDSSRSVAPLSHFSQWLNVRLPSLLELWESLRKPRVHLQDLGAEQNRLYYHLPDGPKQRQRDEMLRNINWDASELLGSSEWGWIDGRYQRQLLGSDVIEEAEWAFEKWLSKSVGR